MKAIESRNYGSPEVFELKELKKPSPKPNEILIRNFASTVTAADIMMRTGKPLIGRLYLGLRKPKRTILGFEFAGKVVEVGNSVSLFKIGDRVFGGTTALGAYAEYVCISEKDVVATMPDNLSYEEAAPVSGSAITVFNFLKGQVSISKGHKVLINGASGALGTYAVQIAKHFGAEVTGVCSNANLEMVSALGAVSVIDYTKNDFTKNGQQYDIIFDTVGKRSYSECKNSLSKNGVYLTAVATLPALMQMVRTSMFGTKKAKTSATGMLPVKKRLEYFTGIKELLKTEDLKTIIDDRYPLSQMADAHRYVERGHKKGNIIITL